MRERQNNQRDNGNRNRGGRAPIPWSFQREFADGGMTVLVWKQDGFTPKWSVQIGFRQPRGKFMPFVPMRAEGDSTAVDTAEVILDLVDQAQNFILEQKRSISGTSVEVTRRRTA